MNDEKFYGLIGKFIKPSTDFIQKGSAKAKQFGENLQDFERKKREIENFKIEYTKKYTALQTSFNVLENFADTKIKSLETQYHFFLENQVRRYNLLYQISEKNNETINPKNLKFDKGKIDNLVLNDDYKEENTDKYILSGTAAGIITSASATGITAAVGTAGTGTAIAGLSGAAFNTSLLAALGGGSIATGGFGMIGGLVTLTGLFTIPAMTFGSYLYIKNKNEQYAKMQEDKTKADQILDAGNKIIDNLKEIISFADKALYELKNITIFTDKMLLIFEKDALFSSSQKSRLLAKSIINLAIDLFKIEIIKDKKFNSEAESILENLHSKADKLQNLFFDYLTGLKPDEKENLEDALQNTNQFKVKPLHKNEIKKQFFQAIYNDAQEEICIISPWLSSSLRQAGNEITNAMRNALEDGIKIKIICGFDDATSNIKISPDIKFKSTDKRYNETLKTAKDLNSQFGKYGDNFKIKMDNTHAKLLICDDKYYMIGSYNFLSFFGDYKNNKGLREEICDQSYNKGMIKFYKERYFNF